VEELRLICFANQPQSATGSNNGSLVPDAQISLNSSTTATRSNSGSLVPDVVNTVICAPDDGWRSHLKHVELFTDKINCVQLHLVEYLLTQNYDARSHEHKKTFI